MPAENAKLRHPTHLLIAAGLASSSCATTARFHRTDGPPVDGIVVDSDAETLTIDVPYHVPQHRRIVRRTTQATIDRATLTDVDHPGNEVAVLSVLPIGASVYLLERGADGLSRGGVSGELGGGILTGLGIGSVAAGIGMLAWGLSTWGESRYATAIHLAPGGVSGRF